MPETRFVCFSATITLRHHMRLLNCELVDNQGSGYVWLSFATEVRGDSLRHQVMSG